MLALSPRPTPSRGPETAAAEGSTPRFPPAGSARRSAPDRNTESKTAPVTESLEHPQQRPA